MEKKAKKIVKETLLACLLLFL